MYLYTVFDLKGTWILATDIRLFIGNFTFQLTKQSHLKDRRVCFLVKTKIYKMLRAGFNTTMVSFCVFNRNKFTCEVPRAEENVLISANHRCLWCRHIRGSYLRFNPLSMQTTHRPTFETGETWLICFEKSRPRISFSLFVCANCVRCRQKTSFWQVRSVLHN